jgi:hypothetical protein
VDTEKYTQNEVIGLVRRQRYGLILKWMLKEGVSVRFGQDFGHGLWWTVEHFSETQYSMERRHLICILVKKQLWFMELKIQATQIIQF